MLRKSKILRRARQWLMTASPGLYIALSRLACRTVLFGRERRFVKSCLPGGSERPSCVLYAANRAGSMFLTRILSELGAENGLTHIDLERFFVHTDRRRLGLLRDREWVASHLGRPGFFFGALRRPLPPPVGETVRGLAVIRDPRDIVVSHFYAVTVGHTVIDREFLEMKQQALEAGIDQWALTYGEDAVAQAIGMWRLGGQDGTLAMRYEDILARGGEALAEIAEALRLEPPSDELRERFDREVKPTGTGDARAHKRSGAHGQFLRELQPATIREFEERHRAEILELGYELSLPEEIAD